MNSLKPPVAKINPEKKTYHGITWEDPYDWLYDRSYPKVDDKAVLDYLKAENAYTEAVMAPHENLIEKLFREMKGRIPEDEKGVPLKNGPYFYNWEYAKDTQYKVWSRTPIKGGDREVILDENSRAANRDYYSVRGLAVSPDHTFLAWSEDTRGAERFTLRIKNLETGRIMGEEIPETIGTPVWSEDSRYIFYLVVNENWRPYQVRRHKLGTPVSEDQVVYEEKDGSFFVGLGKTQSKKFIVINTGDHVTNEVRILPAGKPETEPVLISPRKSKHEYFVDHARGKFYIRTNDVHKNYRIVSAPEDNPGPDHWEETIAPSDDDYMRDLTTFRDFFVVQERIHGIDQIRISDYEGNEHFVNFPEDVYSADIGPNAEYATDQVRLIYESMITPDTVFDYDIEKKDLMTRKVREVPSGYDKSKYETERLMAPARDGVEVPVTLVYRKGLKKDGTNPLHLYGYGAYGLGIPPRFSPLALSLIDRGIIYAIAHVRGGDEMGYQWYEDGKLEKRTNTFFDFIDSAKFLISENYTRAGKISIEGRSAGGELMGFVVNERPDLWRVALLGVPFVDVLNTMLNDDLPLTPIEWPEWGNPIKDKEAFQLIRSYSPYDNIQKQDYPAMFISAGLNDPRVTYWEPAKWTAKIRVHNTGDSPVLLRTNMGAGHAGKSGRYEALKERAEEFAFLLVQFGLAGRE